MINPIAFEMFGIEVYWYGITYALGFIFSYFFIKHYLKYLKINEEMFDDMFFYFMFFSVIGGRIFEIVFYNFSYYFSNPLKVFYVWEGGMSIHGGIFFGFLTLYYYSKKYKVDVLKLTDVFVIPASLFLAFGRLANFINQELVGVVTSSKLGVVFPMVDDKVRYPTQLFESVKNMVVFQVLFYLDNFKKLKSGMITAWFLILYSFGRFFIDFLRTADVNLGIISMGQLLSLVSGVVGVWLFVKAYK